MITLERARQHLATLGLAQAGAVLDSRLEQAAKAQPPYADFLADLLDAEITARRERYLRTRTRLAHLPFQKTLADFDLSFQPSLDARQIKHLATLSFIADAANVLFLGPPGVGKTHLAVALGMEAIQRGVGVYFVTAHALVEDLRQAYAEHRLERRLRIYGAPKLLIIDEIGYLPLEPMGATVLFQLISARYERGSIVLTSNKSFAEWGEIFGDMVIATAILDRLLHHSHIVNIRGESYRLREKRRAGLLGGPPSEKQASRRRPRVWGNFRPAKMIHYWTGLDTTGDPSTASEGIRPLTWALRMRPLSIPPVWCLQGLRIC